MIGYHVTTHKKLSRYLAAGRILPPVRFWKFLDSAKAWSKKTNRLVILSIEVSTSHPLPDHRPRGHAFWSPNIARDFHIVDNGLKENVDAKGA